VAHLFLLIGSGILIKWAFSYLLKRINTQLFIIFTTTIISIFLLTTISFTFLLLKNLSNETLQRLETDVSVLSYALDSKKSEALASASILSENQSVVDALNKKDRKILSTAAENLLLSRKVSSAVILDDSYQVLARGEERDRVGESMSDDLLVKRAMIGESVASLISRDGVMSPIVSVRVVVPIKSGAKVVGVSMITMPLDNNFLDGINQITGLEMSVFGGDVLSATTISNLDDETRPVGIKEINNQVKENVLIKGEKFSGLVPFLNTTYFSVYHPLKDVNNEVVGMLLASRPSSSIFVAASNSIELTFLVTVVMILLSIVPSYAVSKFIYSQLK
jgi:hypothetical protein